MYLSLLRTTIDGSIIFCIYLQDVDGEFLEKFLYLSNLNSSFDLVLLIMLYKKKLKKNYALSDQKVIYKSRALKKAMTQGYHFFFIFFWRSSQNSTWYAKWMKFLGAF